jgi:hypothetical protein
LTTFNFSWVTPKRKITSAGPEAPFHGERQIGINRDGEGRITRPLPTARLLSQFRLPEHGGSDPDRRLAEFISDEPSTDALTDLRPSGTWFRDLVGAVSSSNTNAASPFQRDSQCS